MSARRDGLPGRELIITSVPGRKGTWLATLNGPVFHSLAKFRDADAVEEFRRWVLENEGKPLKLGDAE